MNTIWSTYVQRAETLYCSRALRFSDLFREKYMSAFAIDGRRRLLEIGCGPGALSASLHRWYPDAEITGIDRDSYFIEFARQKAPSLTFTEGDATALSFEDKTFDVTISNTVAEHVEPSKFFGEQYRVLNPGGVCLMLSSRRGVHIAAPCVAVETDFEKEIWQRVEERCAEFDKEHEICRYPMSEQEYPLCMQKYGFRDISTEYITLNLTPDDPLYSQEDAYAMILENRQTRLDGIEILKEIASDLVRADEFAELQRLILQKYDTRLRLYDAKEKQWDTDILMIMVMRGIK